MQDQTAHPYPCPPGYHQLPQRQWQQTIMTIRQGQAGYSSIFHPAASSIGFTLQKRHTVLFSPASLLDLPGVPFSLCTEATHRPIAGSKQVSPMPQVSGINTSPLMPSCWDKSSTKYRTSQGDSPTVGTKHRVDFDSFHKKEFLGKSKNNTVLVLGPGVNGVYWSQEHNTDNTMVAPALWDRTLQSFPGLSSSQSSSRDQNRNQFHSLLMATDSEG